MYGIKQAPKGSPKATITLTVTDNALAEIRHRANVQRMSVDEFVKYAGYINSAIHAIQYLQKLGDPDNPYINKDLSLITDAELRGQISDYFESYKNFIGLKYSNAFFDCTSSGKYTDDKYLTGTTRTLLINTTRWDKENIEGFASLFNVSLNEYLLFATTYETTYIQPLNFDKGISYLNKMLGTAKLIGDSELRKKLKKDILDLRNCLNLLSESSARFYRGRNLT